DNPSPGVKVYLRAHYEFDPDSIRTDFPYYGFAWSEKFRSESSGGWAFRRDHISKKLTADLIAAPQRLSPKPGHKRKPRHARRHRRRGRNCMDSLARRRDRRRVHPI